MRTVENRAGVMALLVANGVSFGKSRAESASGAEGAKKGKGFRLAAGGGEGAGGAGRERRSLDLDIEHIGLRLPGDRARDDAREADAVFGERPEERVEAAAAVRQHCGKCRAFGERRVGGCFSDKKKMGDIDLAADARAEDVEAVDFRGAGRGEGGGILFSGCLRGGCRGAFNRSVARLGVVFQKPIGVVAELGEVGKHAPNRLAAVAEQGDADIERGFLEDRHAARVADEEVDGVMHGAAGGILHGHDAEFRLAREDSFENAVDGRAGDEWRLCPEALAREDAREGSLRSEICDAAHLPGSEARNRRAAQMRRRWRVQIPARRRTVA
jgi:hypothetical protein